jgi:hypothetical protein
MRNGGKDMNPSHLSPPPLLSVSRVDPTGEFFKKQRSVMNGFSTFSVQQINAEDLLKAELLAVRNESEKKYLKLKYAHDTHIGLELLHTFVLDLLGRNTPVAKIFRTKSEEVYEPPPPPLLLLSRPAHLLVAFVTQ